MVAKAPDIGTFAVAGITEPHAFHVVYTRNTNARNYAELFLGTHTENPRSNLPEK